MNEATNWIPGLVVLAVGIVGAVAYLLTARKGTGPAPGVSPGDDLTARYQALLVQLKQHIANKHLLPENVWQAQKAELERAAADVLKQKAEGAKAAKAKSAGAEPAKEAPKAAAQPAPAGDGTLKGALIGGGVVLFVVLVAFQLSAASKPREDDGPMSGGGPMMGGQQQGPSPEEIEEQARLRAKIEAVRKNPDDVDALADAAVFMLRKQAFDEARPYVTRAMSIDPYSPKARVGRAVLVAVDGKAPEAVDQLEHLGRTYPEAFDARLFAGLIALELKDQARAVDNLERYLQVAPADDAPPSMRLAVQQMREQLRQRPGPP